MKKNLMLKCRFLPFLFLYFEAKTQITNYQIQLAVYQDDLQFDRLDAFIKKSGFSDGGKIYQNRIPVGISMDLNFNKYNVGLNYYFSQTSSSYYANKSTLKPSTDMISGRLGRNFWLNEKSYFTVSTFLYGQGFYLEIQNKLPASSPNSILYNPVTFDNYELSSILGGTGYQLSYNLNLKSKDNGYSFDGIALTATVGYKIQVFNQGTWILNMSHQTQNNSTSSIDTKIPNDRLFDSSGLYFTIGIGYHRTVRNERNYNTKSNVL